MKRKITGAIKLLRPTQWIKNAFLFAPIIFSKHLFDPAYLWRETLAFAGFCLVSSTVYIINDIVDREADKLHPLKRNRPLASGAISPTGALVVVVILLFVLFTMLSLFSLTLLVYRSFVFVS